MKLVPSRGRVTAFSHRLGRQAAGPMTAALACALVGAGAIPALALRRPSAVEVVAVALLTLVVAGAIAARLRFRAPSARAQRVSTLLRLAPAFADVEVGLALIAGSYGIAELTGGTQSPFAVAPYAVAAFGATFLHRAGALAVVAAAVTLELAAAAQGRAELADAGARTAWLLLFGLLHAAFLRGLVLRQRVEHRARLEGEVLAMREEARDFRLIASALGSDSRAPRSREEEERKLAEGAVETIHASVFHTLELLKRAQGLKTCVLLWLDESGKLLRVKELVTDSDQVVETAIPADAGAVGAIVRDRIVLGLVTPKRGHLPYYSGAEETGAFLGLPVVEDGHVRGVLCADRAAATPFGPEDEALLAGAAEQILRALRSERVFVAVERSKYEHERFYRASAMLGRALTPEQVMETAFDAASEIVDFELASIALFDRERKRHRVLGVRLKPEAKEMIDERQLEGLEFGDNAGLTAMVVKNKHFLPAAGELRDQSTPIYTRKVKMKGVESLLVLPLVCADDAIGTFTLASRQKQAFGKDARDMLTVIAHQVAVSLENAKMYRQMELMATTDGLTGLNNHRTFQERFSEMLGRAERHGFQLAVVLIDVDFFKKVNDGHGHPVGDQVLRRVAAVLERNVRKIDLVARYGGEEFALVLEATDPAGARALCERIRLDLAGQSFQSEKGAFVVTASLGVAMVPADGVTKEALIDHADQALYFAKEGGRNRTVSWAEVVAEKSRRRARAS